MAETGGYCLPDFVKRGVPLRFAVDNIDFLENTAYRQNTLHGTLLVLFQRDEDGEEINPPLHIPEKTPGKSRAMEIKYREEPVITLNSIRFSSYPLSLGEHMLRKHSMFTHTWAFANFLGNRPTCQISEVPGTSVENDTRPDEYEPGDSEYDSDVHREPVSGNVLHEDGGHDEPTATCSGSRDVYVTGSLDEMIGHGGINDGYGDGAHGATECDDSVPGERSKDDVILEVREGEI